MSTLVKLDYGMDMGATLCGPNNCENLHQFKITVYDCEDDGPATKIVVQRQIAVLSKDTNRENPSPRRQGLEIEFWCEWCDNNHVLQIIQHKGNTFMNWKDE